MRARRGQATAEFALASIVLLGVLLAVLDLGRIGFMQHNLDSGAADLARSLATLTGTNSSGNPSAYVPTSLNPSSAATAAQIQADLSHAAQVAGGAFSSAALASAGAMTLTNGQVTVVGAPDLGAPSTITVTITAPFTLVVGAYIKNKNLHLTASAAMITPAGQNMNPGAGGNVPTNTPATTPIGVATATNTPAPTATNTPAPTATNTPAPTATNTPAPTATNTPAPTATNTPAPTATSTNTPLPTSTPTSTPTNTATPTNTPAPARCTVTVSVPQLDDDGSFSYSFTPTATGDVTVSWTPGSPDNSGTIHLKLDGGGLTPDTSPSVKPKDSTATLDYSADMGAQVPGGATYTVHFYYSGNKYSYAGTATLTYQSTHCP